MEILGVSSNRRQRPDDAFLGGGEVCAKQSDLDYVDDINSVLGDPQDMVTIDLIFSQFEQFSGAILNRSLV